MNTSLRVSWAALLVSAFIIPAFALAADVRIGNSPVVTSSEPSKGNLYLVGGNVTSAGRVGGDLVTLGGTIVVNGPISQDLLIGGGNLMVVGDVGGDIRAGGGNILINGRVGNDVVVAGGSTQISGSSVGGDVLWAGGALQVTAPVGGNMHLAGSEVVINSHVRGDVQFKGNKLTLGKDAVIDGNLNYTAKSEATIEAGAVVKGKTTFEPQKMGTTPGLSAKSILAIFSVFVLGMFLAKLVFALALGLFFRRFAVAVVHTAMEQPLPEMGRGLVVLIVLPIVSIMALVTLIGIPLGVLGLVMFVALMLVSSGLAAIIAGSLAHKWMFKPDDYQLDWKTIFLGVAIYTLLGFIPFVGALAKFLLILLALGSVVKLKWDVVKGWR